MPGGLRVWMWRSSHATHQRSVSAFLFALGGCSDENDPIGSDDSIKTDESELTGTLICQDQTFQFDYELPCNGSVLGPKKHCHSVCTTQYSIGIPTLTPHGPQNNCVDEGTTCVDTCSKCPGEA
jgi:hypothetical protein